MDIEAVAEWLTAAFPGEAAKKGPDWDALAGPDGLARFCRSVGADPEQIARDAAHDPIEARLKEYGE